MSAKDKKGSWKGSWGGGGWHRVAIGGHIRGHAGRAQAEKEGQFVFENESAWRSIVHNT